ncbi:sugar ABC transporter permease [Salinibacterium xinjiangense]|uniref:Carbohydrate ABC transporter membrane protein 2, CUT1 family n=2 Tax=Salinibacterium xinjiangense TaxID=386302 RepID=A0A2C8Z5L4_9MICO|nr:carbohydrate ABC transporter permease [Salinibacterium xinjiangense]GGK93023.1 sugar ABC transporter permease [Salinibacterium xinjiangense]SOE59080.1 carbohydrate ABC transporter membrane protein 2, CUT1 family [Salinibacterium xinjiangense]
MTHRYDPDHASPMRYIVAIAAIAAYALPLYLAIINTFKTNEQIIADPGGAPAPFTMGNVINVLTNPESDIPPTLLRTSLITLTVVTLVVLLGAMLGYYVARHDSAATRVLMLTLLLGLAVPAQVLLIPLTQTFRGLGIMGTYAALIISDVGFFVPFSVLIFSRFVRSIPKELDESASIDGAGPLRSFFLIIFPLTRPAAASVAIFVSVWVWNDFVNPLILLGPATGTTIMAGLYRTLGQYTSDFGTTFAYMFVASVPLLILFLALQRSFISGLTSGSTKG